MSRDPAHASHPDAPENAALRASGRHASSSVMLVEDDVDIRELLEMLLARDSRLGLAQSFGDARDALVAVRDGAPEAIVCDVGLPGMSGLEALPHLRQACPDAIIVMYTAAPDRCDGAMALGADAVVGKDTAPTRLFEHLVELLRRRP
jgi:CheY-like chemotaxis protein